MIDDIDEERMYVVISIRKSTAKRLDALLKEAKRHNRDVETLSYSTSHTSRPRVLHPFLGKRGSDF